MEDGKARKKHVHTHVFQTHTLSQYITFTINYISLKLSKRCNNNAIIRKLVKIYTLILWTKHALAPIRLPIYALTGKTICKQNKMMRHPMKP